MPDSNDQKCEGVMDDQKSSRMSVLKSSRVYSLKIYDKTLAFGAKKHIQRKRQISRKKEVIKASRNQDRRVERKKQEDRQAQTR